MFLAVYAILLGRIFGRFRARSSGNNVKLVNASAMHEAVDPVLNRFLEFLASDIAATTDAPEGSLRSNVVPFPASLLERARHLTAGIVIDHDAPIDGVTAL